MKTPEELASVYISNLAIFEREHSLARSCFLAGYQAAKDQQRKEWETLVSKGKIAMQTLNDQLADANKVIPDTCEHILDMEKMVDVSSSVTLNNSLKNSNSWISVKDRLPDNDEQVLVFGRGTHELNNRVQPAIRNRCTAEGWAGYEIIDWGGEMDDVVNVTHWMPLPKPPEE